MKPAGLTFMVVGAARCGTTSLRHLLAAHPEVHAPTKETYIVTPEMARRGGIDHRVPSVDEHARVFADAAPDGTRAMGEVSSCYLYGHTEAVPKIRSLFGDLQIVAILRDPVERAFSNYLYFARDRRDTRRFAEAVDEEIRDPADGDWGRHYVRMGFYADQVEAYLHSFSRVHIMLFDDLVDDWSGLAAELYGFLGADPSFLPKGKPRFNVSGLPRNPRMYRLVMHPSGIRLRIRSLFSRVVGENRTARIIERFRGRNLDRVPPDPNVRRRLTEIYRDDVERLESLIGRDLSAWKR